MFLRKCLMGSVLAAACLLGSAAPALAVGWGTIVVYEDNVEQGRAYGWFYNENQQYAGMNANVKDSRPGGNGVFVDIDYKYWVQDCADCQAGYQKKGNDQTGRTTSGAWVGPVHEHSDLWGSSNSARGAIQVCEDQSFGPDPCSRPDALPTFSY